MPRVRLHFFLLAASLLASCAPIFGRGGGHDIRVLVYNIHAGKDAGGQDNIARIAGLVRQTTPDVVLLQEVDRGTRRSAGVDQAAELERLTGLTAIFGRTLDYDGGQYGIAVLSRWPVRAETLIHLAVEPPQERAGGSYEPRGALRVTIDAPVGRLVVINTHLDPSGDPRYRRQEIARVATLATEARMTRAKVVLLGGDFNSTPDSEEQLALRATGARDSWAECGVGNALTYPADSAVKRIDYLFLSRAARCVDARVLRSDISDHRPLLVVVRP